MTGTGFWWIFLVCALYGIVHSILASHRIKALAARQFGQPAYHRFYRLFFVVTAGITALPLLVLTALLPDRGIYRIPSPWVYLTLSIQALAVLSLLLAVMQTGAFAFLGIQQVLGHHPAHRAPVAERLVVDGLYRWVRHPLYAASFLLLWFAPVMTWNLLAFNLGLSAYMLIGTIFEERKLIQQFGDRYIEYRKRTPRILPFLRKS